MMSHHLMTSYEQFIQAMYHFTQRNDRYSSSLVAFMEIFKEMSHIFIVKGVKDCLRTTKNPSLLKKLFTK